MEIIMDDFTTDLAGTLSKQITSRGKTIKILLEELDEDYWHMDIIGRSNLRFSWYDSFGNPEQALWFIRCIIKRKGIGELYSGKHSGYMDTP
jgi:hypothetical protein